MSKKKTRPVIFKTWPVLPPKVLALRMRDRDVVGRRLDSRPGVGRLHRRLHLSRWNTSILPNNTLLAVQERVVLKNGEATLRFQSCSRLGTSLPVQHVQLPIRACWWLGRD